MRSVLSTTQHFTILSRFPKASTQLARGRVLGGEESSISETQCTPRSGFLSLANARINSLASTLRRQWVVGGILSQHSVCVHENVKSALALQYGVLHEKRQLMRGNGRGAWEGA